MRRSTSIVILSVTILLSTGVQAMAAVNPFSAIDLLIANRNVVRKKVSRNLQIERAIRKVFGPQHDDTAICIANAESSGPGPQGYWRPGMVMRFNTSAWSQTGDHGLFQANYLAHHWPHESEKAFHARMSQTWYNINWAYRLSRDGKSFAAWTGTYGRGLCHGLS